MLSIINYDIFWTIWLQNKMKTLDCYVEHFSEQFPTFTCSRQININIHLELFVHLTNLIFTLLLALFSANTKCFTAFTS